MIRESLEIQMTAEKVIGIENLRELEQGSIDWHTVRLGVFTASTANDLLAKKTSKTYENLIYKKASEVMAPEVDDNQINAATLLWGKSNEDAARSAYELIQDKKTERVGFLFGDSSLRYGCSPDFLEEEEGGEIKCPVSRTFSEILHTGKIPKNWYMQMHFSMMVTDTKFWSLVIYDPRMVRNKVIIKRFPRDAETIVALRSELYQAIQMVDEILDCNQYKWGDQWGDRVSIAQRGSSERR